MEYNIEEQDIQNEIERLQKVNHRNKIIIIALLFVLAFVIIMTIHIRFFGWKIINIKLKYY